MDSELKQRWLEALRSGEYGQTTVGTLRDADGSGYCCLGVLCDVIDPDGWSEYGADIGMHRSWAGQSAGGYLPPIAQAMTGLDKHGTFRSDTGVPIAQAMTGLDKHGTFRSDTGYFDTLAGLNDEGASFAEIADVIEKYL